MTKKKTLQQVLLEFNQIHGDKYDYSKVDYKNANIKIIITCKIHGDFEQIPSSHLSGSGCPKCAGTNKKTTEQFITNAIAIHGDRYDYSKTIYTINRNKIIIICKIHGDFEQRSGSHLNSQGCKECGHLTKQVKLTDNTESFIEKAKKIHEEKYDYTKVDYTKSTIKVTIICQTHGEFEQIPSSHLSGSGCPKCGIIKTKEKITKTTKEFIIQANQIHKNKYDYSKTNYINTHSKIIIICKKHGEFEQEAKGHLYSTGCPKCSNKIKKTNEEFEQECYKKFGNEHYDYSDVEYINANTKVEIYCLIHDISFWQAPHEHLRGNQGCYKCRLTCESCGIFESTTNNHKLCEYCNPNDKKNKVLKEKTKEMKVVRFLKDKLPEVNFIHNKSVGRECNDNLTDLYPDIRVDCDFYYLIIEIDEFQHRGANYECDEKRMYDIIAKLGMPCIFIRYNPDTKESNLDDLLDIVSQGLNIEFNDSGEYLWDDFGLLTEYMYYN